LLAALRQRWPGVSFVGTVGIGVAAGGVEYFDEPALVVMLSGAPREQFQVFNGAAGLRGARSPARRAATALVHADPATPDLSELLGELADRTESGYLFGGMSSARQRHVQIADGVFQGGLSGVAFGADMPVISRVTQGCTPLGPSRRVTASDGSVVLQLDGVPALPQLLVDLRVAGPHRTREQLRGLVPRLRRTLVGLTEPAPDTAALPVSRPGRPRAGHGNFGEEVRVRHLVGIDPGRQAFAVAEPVQPGMGLIFCERDAVAARRDLVRMCTEIRDEIETRVEATRMAAGAGAPLEGPPAAGMLGAVYVSCAGRGGPHFGGPSAEMQIVRHALGDVPLVGFFASGEIGYRQLYGYTGVLTVFV
jgi:small ligand-binding sensory domain FIST